MTTPDPEQIAAGLRRGDAKLVLNAIHTHGGGIWYDLIPAAQLKRLLALGLLAHKPVTQRDPLKPVVHGLIIHGPNANAVRNIVKDQPND